MVYVGKLSFLSVVIYITLSSLCASTTQALATFPIITKDIPVLGENEGNQGNEGGHDNGDNCGLGNNDGNHGNCGGHGGSGGNGGNGGNEEDPCEDLEIKKKCVTTCDDEDNDVVKQTCTFSQGCVKIQIILKYKDNKLESVVVEAKQACKSVKYSQELQYSRGPVHCKTTMTVDGTVVCLP